MKTKFTTKRLITGILASVISLMTLLTLAIPFIQVDILGLHLAETGFSLLDFEFDEIFGIENWIAHTLGGLSLFQLILSIITMLFSVLSIFFFSDTAKNRLLIGLLSGCLFLTISYMIFGIVYVSEVPYYSLFDDGSFRVTVSTMQGSILSFETSTLAYLGFILTALLFITYIVCEIVIKAPKDASKLNEQVLQHNVDAAKSTAEDASKLNEQILQHNVFTAKSIAEELKQYKELLDTGIITQEEFEKKKKEILNV